MLQCKSCGTALDLTMACCPACGADVPMGRLTGILGLVCRSCDAYNDPGARQCVSCGKPLGTAAPAPGAGPGAALRGPGAPAGASPARGRPATPPPLPAARTPAPQRPPRRPPTPSPAAPGTAQWSAQEPVRRARLLVERGEAPAGTAFALSGDEVQAGRSQGVVTFPSDPCLAPHHATFLSQGSQLALRDEGAPGGVFVRIPRGQAVPLRPGGLFAVGDRLLRFAGILPAQPPPPPDGTLRLGAPRPDGPAVLVEEWMEGGVGGRVYLRTGPSVTVGRAGCSVNLGDDPYLSQAHAEIAVDADGATTLRDLGSPNGTFVRIAPGGEVPLQDGDMLRMGREVLRIELR